jgi:hypothetical protein
MAQRLAVIGPPFFPQREEKQQQNGVGRVVVF